MKKLVKIFVILLFVALLADKATAIVIAIVQIVMAIGSFTWIAGIAGMLFFTTWKFYRFHKWVREAVPDKSLGKRIYRGDVTTPVVVGVLNPRIYLPWSGHFSLSA